MDTNTRITQAYQQIKDCLNAKLTLQRYLIVHEQHDDKVFASRYVIWSNNADALRLTWDGKESWFILEIAHSLPLSVLTAWEDIIDAPYDPLKHDKVYLDVICKKIVHSLD